MGIFDSYCTSKARLDGKVAVVTGCNTGIGKETVKDFYLRGCHVIMACRTVSKAAEAMEDIKKSCKDRLGIGTIEVMELNLSSTASIRECAQQLLERDMQINLLINNAGVMMTPYARTDDGFEVQFGTNHLGHFLLTLLLLPKMIKSKPARIVNVSSRLHTRGQLNMDDMNWEKRRYNTSDAYANSKLYNILFTKELAKRLEDANIQGVNVYSLHPGVVATDIGRNFDDTCFPGMSFCWKYPGKLFLKSIKQGAQTSIYCAVDEKAANETGLYYAECKVTTPSSNARNPEYAKKLWEESIKYVKLEGYDPFKI